MRCGRWLVAALLLSGCDGFTEPGQTAAGPEPDCDVTFDYPLDDSLQLTHLQAKSTHNSYHVEPEGNTLKDWGYTMPPLDRQLGELGVRHFELDIRYNAELGQIEVYHLPLIDEQTTCRLLTDCLATIKTWSDAHQAHHVIVVHIEPKDGVPVDVESYLDRLHTTITSVWPSTCLITPALVQGSHDTLAEAVQSDGWPTLGTARRKILFVMLDRGEWRDAYTHGRAHLDGRLLFAEGDPGEPYAVVARVDDPISGADNIAAALDANMLVRTRADSGSVEPLAGDTTRLQAALASGAHFVSTDYPGPVTEHDYWLDLPGGTPSRCNPVTAPPECTSEAIEDPALVGD